MPKNRNFSLRIEIIDQCLRNRRHKWTLEALAKKINEALLERGENEVTIRTIQEDFKYLRREKDAPIKRIRDGTMNYFTYNEAQYSIKKLPLDEEEIAYLKDAIQILYQVNNFKIIEEVKGIVQKLENTISTNVPYLPSLIQFEGIRLASGSEYIDPLFYAAKEKLALRITYRPFSAATHAEFVYHPYLLKEYRNRWFLFCRKEHNNKISTLALDRITQIRNTNEKFIANDLFDPETHFEHLIGVSIPENEIIEKIELKVSKNQAPYILSKPIHQSQEVAKRYRNGDILIRLCLMVNYELKSVLLSYGPDVQVKIPVSLRKGMLSLYTKGSKNYAGTK